jgi:uncharacterized protein
MKKIEEKESIVFEIDGQKLFGILHMPINHGKNVPGVLMCHGLAGNKTGRFRLYVHLAKALAKAGIASLRVDFRGCGDSDGEFSEATVSGFLKDAQTSLQLLIHHAGIDPERIGIFGRSFGAAIALMTAHDYKKIKSLALWAPLYNTMQWQKKWRYFNEETTSKHERDLMLSIDGQLGNFAFFDEFFKIDLESKLDLLQHIPLLHIHGTKDAIIDIHHADFYQEKRKTAQAPSKFIRLVDGDHEFSKRQDQLISIDETVEWFNTTLRK